MKSNEWTENAQRSITERRTAHETVEEKKHLRKDTEFNTKMLDVLEMLENGRE